MHLRRFQFFFTIAFVISGVAIGLIWILRELRHPTSAVATAPVEDKPFQPVAEALAEAPACDAEHLRQLLDAEVPMPQPSVSPVSLAFAPPQALTVVTPPPATEAAAGESASVVYDASVEMENTQRLVDSFAPLRDPAVSLDSPENRNAILQMQANAAKRALEAPKSLPKPQR